LKFVVAKRHQSWNALITLGQIAATCSDNQAKNNLRSGKNRKLYTKNIDSYKIGSRFSLFFYYIL
jgi:hypothetical protein